MSLIAVIDHIGDSQRSGHYSTQCWNEFKQKWCLLDDMDTEEIDEDMRSTENTYVAIYSFVNETKELEKRKEEELRGNINKKRKEEKEATAKESHNNAEGDDIEDYNEVDSISFSPVDVPCEKANSKSTELQNVANSENGKLEKTEEPESKDGEIDVVSSEDGQTTEVQILSPTEETSKEGTAGKDTEAEKLKKMRKTCQSREGPRGITSQVKKGKKKSWRQKYAPKRKDKKMQNH